MATIADLLARLEGLAMTLGPPDEASGLESHVAGWMPLAQQTLRAVSNLPTGGRPARVSAGLLAVLGPLAKGPRRPMEIRPLDRLSDLALIMGAISDVLADNNFGRQPRPEFVGREAAKLEAGLLSAVHLTARWSLGSLERQNLPGTRVSTKRLLRDLVALTEPWALIPPASRGSILEDLRIRTNTAPGLEGAMVAWADAVEGGQAYSVLRGYKQPNAQEQYWTAAATWAVWFLGRHGACAQTMSGRRTSDWMWATVPSARSGRLGEHPLHRIVQRFWGAAHVEAPLALTAGAEGQGRGYAPSKFTAAPIAPGSHVILVDDSWTTGANVQSAATALKVAGAGQVSAMILARLLNDSWEPTRAFLAQAGLRSPFNPNTCPWPGQPSHAA